jgi:hypothetical protein
VKLIIVRGMAAEPDQVGPHFLDVVNKRRAEENQPRDSITRLCYVATWGGVMTPGQAGAAHDKMINSLDDANVSGVLLIQSESLINLVETKEDVAMDLLRQLSDNSSFTNVRVIVSAEDCPSRIFSDWNYRVVQSGAEADIDLGHEDLATAGYSIYSKILKIGKQIAEQRLDASDALDRLSDNWPDLIPSQDRVLAFSAFDGVQSLAEYMQMYDAPIKVTLESELVWPIQPFVQY